jgi:predicted HicB family RNase H-like nuclease
LKLSNSVKSAAAELAKLDGVSLNQFIAAAVAEKVGNSSKARLSSKKMISL